MAKYINKELFLSSMGLVGDETKYGNRDPEHGSRSYSTWMGYEIMDSVDDCEDEDAVRVVRCKDCKHTDTDGMKDPAIYCQKWDYWEIPEDFYCAYGERRNDG